MDKNNELPMTLRELSERAFLLCGAEAVARGFSAECGYEMYEGIAQEAREDWSEQKFLGWAVKMEEKYGRKDDLIDLHEWCGDFMEEYKAKFGAHIQS